MINPAQFHPKKARTNGQYMGKIPSYPSHLSATPQTIRYRLTIYNWLCKLDTM